MQIYMIFPESSPISQNTSYTIIPTAIMLKKEIPHQNLM